MTGYNVFTFPSIDGSAPAAVGGGDLFVELQDERRRDGVPRVPDDARGGGDLGSPGGFSSPNKNVDESVYPDDDHAGDRDRRSPRRRTFRFDMSDLQPSAFGGTPGQGLFKAFTDFVENPNDIDGVTQQMESGREEGLQELGPTLCLMSEHATTVEAPGGGFHRRTASPASCSSTASRSCSSRPRSCCWASGSSIRRSRTIIRSFYDRDGDSSSGSTTTRRCSRDDTIVTAIKNNFLWLLIVPAFVTAIGLVFAVLLERIASRSPSRSSSSCRWRSRSSRPA